MPTRNSKLKAPIEAEKEVSKVEGLKAKKNL